MHQRFLGKRKKKINAKIRWDSYIAAHFIEDTLLAGTNPLLLLLAPASVCGARLLRKWTMSSWHKTTSPEFRCGPFPGLLSPFPRTCSCFRIPGCPVGPSPCHGGIQTLSQPHNLWIQGQTLGQTAKPSQGLVCCFHTDAQWDKFKIFPAKSLLDQKHSANLKRPWCWERLKAGGGDDRGWDGWMTSPTQWTWVQVNSGSWWWTGRPGVLQSMGSQRVRHDWATELN